MKDLKQKTFQLSAPKSVILAKECLGEFLGTLILVLIGCSSIAVALLYYPLALWQVAFVWGVGVAIAIYSVNRLGPAHLNPAVSVGMFVAKQVSSKKLLLYLLCQLVGAFVAGFLLLIAINTDLAAFEKANGWQRGDVDSYHSAVMFGEFYPNPGYEQELDVGHVQACVAECFGTFVLVFVIFWLTSTDRGIDAFNPILIGLTVSLIILFVAPYTQAGLNPARDLGPRMVAYLHGWGHATLPAQPIGALTVYVIAPVVGGSLAGILRFQKMVAEA